jgi:HDOD domain-containing protein
MLADCCNVEKATGYTSGLLHDIGRMALLMLFPTDYAKLTQRFVSRTPDEMQAERTLCDVDHCQIGYHLAESWHFPMAISDVIAHHHDPAGPETPRLRLLVQAACIAANMSGFHATGTGSAWDSGRLAGLLPCWKRAAASARRSDEGKSRRGVQRRRSRTGLGPTDLRRAAVIGNNGSYLRSGFPDPALLNSSGAECSLSASIARRRCSHRVASQHRLAQDAPAVQPAKTSEGQCTPR